VEKIASAALYISATPPKIKRIRKSMTRKPMNTLKILRFAKKKRGLTIRDTHYWNLEQLVKEDLLNKSYPKNKRGAGWPFYKISRRGLRRLKKANEAFRANQNQHRRA
jgi:hypothetical protein